MALPYTYLSIRERLLIKVKYLMKYISSRDAPVQTFVTGPVPVLVQVLEPVLGRYLFPKPVPLEQVPT